MIDFTDKPRGPDSLHVPERSGRDLTVTCLRWARNQGESASSHSAREEGEMEPVSGRTMKRLKLDALVGRFAIGAGAVGLRHTGSSPVAGGKNLERSSVNRFAGWEGTVRFAVISLPTGRSKPSPTRRKSGANDLLEASRGPGRCWSVP